MEDKEVLKLFEVYKVLQGEYIGHGNSGSATPGRIYELEKGSTGQVGMVSVLFIDDSGYQNHYYADRFRIIEPADYFIHEPITKKSCEI